jgi:hypothetical protein
MPAAHKQGRFASEVNGSAKPGESKRGPPFPVKTTGTHKTRKVAAT